MEEELVLGKEGKDIVTGFSGILVGRADYLYGCTQWCIVPPYNKGINLREDEYKMWFDEKRIKIIGSGILPKENLGKGHKGGPNNLNP